jgi:hypothetical protein
MEYLNMNRKERKQVKVLDKRKKQELIDSINQPKIVGVGLQAYCLRQLTPVRELGEAGLAGRRGLYFFVTKEELLTLP